MSEQASTVFSAIDLLHKVMEFTAMAPNPNEWTANAWASNPPRAIRFRQIDALLQAFFADLKPQAPKRTSFWDAFSGNPKLPEERVTVSIADFLAGNFIQQRSDEMYKPVFGFIRDFMAQRGIAPAQHEVSPKHVLAFVYPKLIAYKKLLYQIRSFNSGWLEASSIVAHFSIRVTQDITAHLHDTDHSLNHALELFINPQELTFTRDELAARYGYPTDNLDEIDIDYW